MTAEAVITALHLKPHPEGGRFREIYRRQAAPGARSTMTSIYYLLRAGERSAWHRLREADEIWYFQAGDPLELRLARTMDSYEALYLGASPGGGQQPQVIIPAGCWQSAIPLGAWTLVGCAVSPGFEFADFEMAPADFQPAPT